MSPSVSVLHVLEAVKGGTRRWIENVLPRLHSERCRHSLLCSLKRDVTFGETIQRFRQSGIDVWTVDMTRDIRPLTDVRSIRFMVRLLGQTHFDVIHAHSSKAGAIARIASMWGERVPVVYTPHAFAFLSGGVKGEIYRVLERVQIPFTHTLMAVSRAEADAGRRMGYCDEQVETIPNAVECTAEMPDYGNSPAKARTIGSVSRFCRQKDPLTFLIACKLLRETHPELHYVLCGRGPLERSVRKFAAQPYFDGAIRIEYPGQQADDVLQTLDIFVSTSRYEGLSFSLLDAMSFGKPIVATRVPGNDEAMIDGVSGLLVSPDDPQAIANAVSRLVEDPDLAARLGDGARRRVRELFSLDTQLCRLREFYLRFANAEGVAS